ncbi:MAG: FHA domain-containing protein [Leifsonia sp.]
MAESDFIVPPPGLIPARPEADAPASEAEPIVATYPSFRPVQPQPLPTLPPAAAAVPTPAAVTAPVPRQDGEPGTGQWLLHLGDGRSVAVDGTVVIGRDPAAVAGHPLATLLAVTDATRSVSKTHALVDLEAGDLVVTDLHSTNGVVVTRTDGTVTEAVPATRLALQDGDALALGEFLVRVSRE